jgi:Tfp pilus assembly protein PilN
MVDFKKEIKLSDLFRHRAKDPNTEAAAAAATPDAPSAEEPKKERRALFARAPREKEPKQRRRRGAKAPAVEPKSAPELPQIPLMRAFDLMPKEETREKGGRVGLAKIAVALLGLVLFAGLAAAYLFTGAAVMTKQGELDDLRAQLAELDVASEEPTSGAPALAGQGQARTTALSAALAIRIAWDRILREVSLVLPEDVWLTQLSATTPNAAQGGAGAPPPAAAAGSTSPNSLTAVGLARSHESVALFLSRLESIPELTMVQLQASTGADSETGRVYSFTILAGVDPLGAPSS